MDNASGAGRAPYGKRSGASRPGGRAPAQARKPGRSGAARRRRMRRRAIAREVCAWIVTLALAALIAVGVRTFVCEIVRVDGPSMEPTLTGGEMLLVTKFDYAFSTPARGDVVVCRFPNRDGTFVKRVIGLPGDKVQIVDGRTYIDDLLLEENFVSFPADEDYGPVLIGDGQYLVMGDNRAVSHDGRAADVGTLRADALVGRVRSVVYPLGSLRSIGS